MSIVLFILVFTLQDADIVMPLDGRPTQRSPFQAGILALRQPAAYFVPLAAALVSLVNIRRLLEAITLHVQKDPQNMKGVAGHVARNANWLLTGLDLLVKEGTQLACIAFG